MKRLRAAIEHFKRGEYEPALQAVQSVLEASPEQLDALVLASQIHQALGNLDRVVVYLNRALAQAPGHAVLTANLAAAYLALGQPETAESLAEVAVQNRPGHFGARLNLGLSRFAQRKYGSSAVDLARALEIRPDSLVAMKNLAQALKRSKQSYFKARNMLETVLKRSPGDPETLAMLADSYIQNAETKRGLSLFEELLGSTVDVTGRGASRYHDSYLLALQYRRSTTPKELYEASREWADRYCQPRSGKPAGHGGEKLRIGWLSPRFTGGPVACFLLSILAAFDRDSSEHYLYAARSQEGPLKGQFKDLSDRWRELDGLSTVEASMLIARDELDVLVDLSGHSPGGMLTSMCERLATVQVSWMDSFCTTGMEQIDAFITDSYLSPPGDEQYFTEHLIRVEPGRLCYRPQEPIAEISRNADDGIVFASYNRLSKLGDEVLAAWAEILEAVPGSRLQLRNTMFDDDEVCEAFFRRGDIIGLSRDRVALLGYCDYLEVMTSYAGVDIVLDPFPFSGCTTTCDALWMGVPVITQTGSTLVSRQSGSVLDSLGLGAFISDSTQGYVKSAIQLARDETRRSELRTELRTKMKTVYDPRQFAASLLGHFQHLAAGKG